MTFARLCLPWTLTASSGLSSQRRASARLSIRRRLTTTTTTAAAAAETEAEAAAVVCAPTPARISYRPRQEAVGSGRDRTSHYVSAAGSGRRCRLRSVPVSSSRRVSAVTLMAQIGRRGRAAVLRVRCGLWSRTVVQGCGPEL